MRGVNSELLDHSKNPISSVAKQVIDELGIPNFAKPDEPLPEVMPNLDELTIRQLEHLLGIAVGWQQYVGMALSNMRILEAAKFDEYQYKLRHAAKGISARTKEGALAIAESGDSESAKELRRLRKEWEQLRQIRVYLGGHKTDRGEKAGILAQIVAGKDAVSRAITSHGIRVAEEGATP